MAASMALQVVVSPFLGVLCDKFSNLIQKEVGLIWGVDKEMMKLSNTLSTIRDVLEDAEEKQMMNRAVANWLLKLRALVCEADNILDEWATEAMQLQLGRKHTTCTNLVSDSFLSCFHFKQLKFCRKTAKTMSEIRQKFDEMASERCKFDLRVGVPGRSGYYQKRETSSFLAEPDVYGRDDDREYIVRLLLDNAKSPDLFIFPIVGIGGLGKTTVAQLCFNEERVKEHFEIRIWVCVSDNFDVKNLTRAILVSNSRDTTGIDHLDPLQRCLQEELAKKRFLLVLDDVWTENQEEWNKLRYSLDCGAEGSSVIVTTRLKTVASITGTCRPYFLKSLAHNDCWSLFKQRAFGMGNEERPNLVKIGNEIVEKCGGLPLAAKVMGGLMRFKEEESDWLLIRDSRTWDLPQSDDNILLPALKLSYTNLSPHLRQCFAYCSIFPKGHKMEREELIRLWMANGLFQSREEMQLEGIGNEIFNALSWRSFFQDEQVGSDGRIVSCTMHDLVHELACSININECYHLGEVNKNTGIPLCTRHLSVSLKTNPSSVIQFILQSPSSLHTLILLSDPWGNDLPIDFILSRFKSLRALSLESDEIVKLPDSIGNLKHLRYLNFSRTRLAFLPESICELINLQRLDLEECYGLQKLPKCMRKMSNLRHLNIRGCNRLHEMPVGMGRLTCLQTLSMFIVGVDKGRHINELEQLDCLGGKLEIKGLEHVKTLEDARKSKLMRKQSLHSLNLVWSYSDLEGTHHTEVIQGLQPPPNIKELSIKGYQGLSISSWLDDSPLASLKKVQVCGCSCLQSLPLVGRSLTDLGIYSCSNLTSLSQALRYQTNLQHLVIDGCPKVDLSNVEYEHLISLRTLILKGIPDLTSLPCGLQHTTTLHRLRIENCPALISLPNWIGRLTSLKYLHLSDCKNVKTLPDGLQQLTNLQVLSIAKCHPELRGRCVREGEDWPKIAHIQTARVFSNF